MLLFLLTLELLLTFLFVLLMLSLCLHFHLCLCLSPLKPLPSLELMSLPCLLAYVPAYAVLTLLFMHTLFTCAYRYILMFMLMPLLVLLLVLMLYVNLCFC